MDRCRDFCRRFRGNHRACLVVSAKGRLGTVRADESPTGTRRLAGSPGNRLEFRRRKRTQDLCTHTPEERETPPDHRDIPAHAASDTLDFTAGVHADGWDTTVIWVTWTPPPIRRRREQTSTRLLIAEHLNQSDMMRDHMRKRSASDMLRDEIQKGREQGSGITGSD